MDNVTSQFHTLVTDGDTEQILLLMECERNTMPDGAFYLSSDGDMTVDGATFVDELASGENYTLGCVPSRTMNVTLMNLDGSLSGHNFGWLEAFVGVQYTHFTDTLPSGTYCQLDYQGAKQEWDGLYECRQGGFYKDGVRIGLPGDCTGCLTVGDGLFYHFVTYRGSQSVRVYDAENDLLFYTVKDFPLGEPTQALRSKFADGRFVMVDVDRRLFFDIHGAENDCYYLSCLGHFRVDRPSRTMGQTISISDAFDVVHELDVDASELLAKVSGSVNNGYQLLNALLTHCGLGPEFSNETISTRLKNISVDLTTLAENSYTCRRLVSYLLEAVGANARLRNGSCGLQIYIPNEEQSAKACPVTADRVAAGSLEVQEYISHAVDRISVKTLSGDTVMYPSVGNYVYAYEGNPFVTDATYGLLTYARQIPEYTPMSLSVIEADPSFQCGDLVLIELDYGEDEVLLDRYSDPITTHDDEEILIVPSQGKWVIPLMSQTITWKGKASAVYEAKGSEDRTGYVSGNYADVNARVKTGGSAGGNISQFYNDVGYLTLSTLPIYGADVQIVYNGEVS